MLTLVWNILVFFTSGAEAGCRVQAILVESSPASWVVVNQVLLFAEEPKTIKDTNPLIALLNKFFFFFWGGGGWGALRKQ